MADVDAEESRRWWEARRWPEDHPERVRSRQEHAATSGYESLDAAGRARVDRALRRGQALEDPREAAVAVALARTRRPDLLTGRPARGVLWMLLGVNVVVLGFSARLVSIGPAAGLVGAVLVIAGAVLGERRRRRVLRRVVELNEPAAP